jgi:excinuclease ABC subunit C
VTSLEQTLQNLPTKPGVYLHKDAKGKILYVGKAKNLRSRVRSYFHKGQKHSPRIALMVPKVVSIDTIITRNEVEALLVESNLIKQYRPPYNVVLRDDKHYVFIKMTTSETWPRVFTVRRTTAGKDRYFGPYTSGWNVRKSLKALRHVFPWCDLVHKLPDPTKNTRPCFHYRLGLCPGACIGKVTPMEYTESLQGLIRFLDGEDSAGVAARLEQEMSDAAARQDYERAARCRDRLTALEDIQQRQQAIDPKQRNRDVVGLARDQGHAVVILLTIRHGRVVARKEFTFWGEGEADDSEVLDSFIGQYYKVATNLPDEVLLPADVANAPIVAEILSQQRGRKVLVEHPKRGERRSLLDLAKRNADDFLRQLRQSWIADEASTGAALSDLAQKLALNDTPQRIECYDISNLTGTATTASMVVFVDGHPKKTDYRRFSIKEVEGIDDFASMREVLRRRFAKVAASNDDSFGRLPNLVVVDGGKGQVGAAATVLGELGLTNVPLIGLAKRQEEVVVKRGDSYETTLLPGDTPGLYLLQRIRDEAHRFAISYNRSVRSRKGTQSALDALPGIGPVKRKALLRAFHSVAGVRAASEAEIATVVGPKLAAELKERL